MKKKAKKTTKTENETQFASAYLKALRISPLKLRQVTRMITGLPVEKAVMQLTFCKKRIAKDVKELLRSAMANAENNQGMDIDNLYVYKVDVGKAFVMKRFRPRAKGRGCRILKPFSNIRIVLTEKKE